MTDFQCDSRLVKKGGVFCALKGAKTDGHLFLQEAEAKGAIAAIVDEQFIYNKSTKLKLFKSDNVINSIHFLAKQTIQRRKTKVIGITGSVGKTTTKDFLYDILKDYYKVEKSPLSYNSQVTFPLNILNSNSDIDFLILEMGISKVKEMDRLVKIVKPYISLIFNENKLKCSNKYLKM